MSRDEIFSNPRIKGALDQLMDSEEGRELAQKLRTKLKELNDQFKGLPVEEKQQFLKDFSGKFSESMGDLKDTLSMKMGERVDGEFNFHDNERSQIRDPEVDDNFSYYWPFLGAVFVILLIFGLQS